MKLTMVPTKRRIDGAVIAGGMDVVVSPIYAKPGLARLAYNYEYSSSGGIDRVRGIEPFDGRPAPSDAVYTYLNCTVDIVGISLGDTVTGGTSAATGKVIYLSGPFIAMTRVVGLFAVEDLKVGGVTKATVLDASPGLDGFLDNTLAKLAADDYQADITKIPGEGRVRGVAILNDVVYGWRNNVGSTALAIYKSTTGGWVNVPMLYELSFTVGSGTQPAEGSTITQGGTTATLKRVVLESGTYGAGTAAGRYIITAPAGGGFAPGALAGTLGTVPAAGAGIYIGTQVTLAPSGVVRTVRYTFTTLSAMRLYGCDGVNREFEFDGTTLVPIATGMGSIRASAVSCHKKFLMYAYIGSVQFSGLGNPYVWAPLFGAGEFATGDVINDMLSIGGQSDAASLFVTCENSLHVLYGTSAIDFQLVPLSHVSGGQRFAAQDIGGVVTLDTPGIMRYPTTRNFGNFSWDNVSTSIRPLVVAEACAASVYASNVYKYRIFFADGTAVSGLPIGNKQFAWSVIDYGLNILVAICDDIANTARTFYGDDNGWVYEADKGRSFAGLEIEYAIKLHPLSQRSPMVEKSYWITQIELTATSALTLRSSVEFGNNDDGGTESQVSPRYGPGAMFDLTQFDTSYWDVGEAARVIVPSEGQGTSIAITIYGKAADELTHSMYSVQTAYDQRKVIV